MSYGLLVVSAFLFFAATRVELGGEFRVGFCVLGTVLSVLAMIAGFNNY